MTSFGFPIKKAPKVDPEKLNQELMTVIRRIAIEKFPENKVKQEEFILALIEDLYM